MLNGDLQTGSFQYNPELFGSQQKVYPVRQVNTYRGAVVFHLIFFYSLKNCSLIHFFRKTIFLCEVAGYKKCSETNEVSLNYNDSQRQSPKSYIETRVTKKASCKQLPETLPHLFLLLRNYAVSKQVRAAVHRILLFHHSAVTGFILVS